MECVQPEAVEGHSTLLIVDDYPENLLSMRALLQRQDWRVMTAASGIEALDLLLQHEIDLVLLDVQMPGMDGFSLCRQWKTDEQLRGIPFIFYTATYTDPKDEDFALSLGAERFVRKPAEVDVFIRIVKEVLDQFKKRKPEFPSSPITEEKVFLKNTMKP